MGVSFVGAPAVLNPEADYFTNYGTVKHIVGLSPCDTKPIESQSVAIRRWHAARLSCVLTMYRDLKNIKSIEDLQDSRIVPFDQWSEDAKIAARALIREFTTPGMWNGETVPGFNGPRDWYEEE